MIRIMLLAISIVSFPMFANPAFTFCLSPKPRVRTELFDSGIVFVGRVVSAEIVEDKKGFIAGTFYRLNVWTVYRGPKLGSVEVFTENASARMPLRLGGSYLLFADSAWKGAFADVLPKNKTVEFTMVSCGNSKEILDAGPFSSKDSSWRADSSVQEIVKSLKEEKEKAGGSIRGHVSGEGDKGVSGVVFEVRGSGQVYVVKSDKDGWLEVRVPAGHYSLVPRSDSKVKVKKYDLSYSDPNELNVVDGGGTEVEYIVATP